MDEGGIKNELCSKNSREKLLLIDPSHTITPKRQARAYGTELSHSLVRDVQDFINDFEFSGIPVKITTTLANNEATILSPKREEEKMKPTKYSKKRKRSQLSKK